MTAYKLSCGLRLSKSLPAFVLPIFTADGGFSHFAQELNASGLIEKMLPVPSVYIKQDDVAFGNINANVEVGGEGLFLFAKSYDDFVYGDKQMVAQFLEINLADMQMLPVTKLSVLNFIGANYVEKFEAIEAVADKICDKNIRREFIEIENSIVEVNEVEVEIDDLISKLLRSGNFSETHDIVEKASKLLDNPNYG